MLYKIISKREQEEFEVKIKDYASYNSTFPFLIL